MLAAPMRAAAETPLAGGSAPRTPALRDPFLWGAMAVALALRLALLLRYPDNRGVGDETIHYVMSVLAAHLGPQVFGQWAPGYDALLAAIFRVFGPDPFVAKLFQTAISTATLPLVYDLARAGGSRRAARIAAALFALDPTLAAYTHYLFSETLFVALFVLAAWLLFRRGGERGVGDCVAAGAVFGLAVLTRSVGIYFLLLWAAWSAFRGRRHEARDAAVVLAVTLAVLAPWTVRNAFKYHGFLLVDGTLGRTAYFAFSDVWFNQDLGFLGWQQQTRNREECKVGRAPGLDPLPPVAELEALFPPGMGGILGARPAALPISRTRHFASLDLVASQRCELAHAFEFARREPVTTAANLARRLYAFWGPNSFVLRWTHEGVYGAGPLGPAHYRPLKWTVVALHVFVLAAALLAWGRRGAGDFARWVALFVLYYSAIHALAVAHSRYRLPVMPFLMVIGAGWLADPRPPEGGARGAAVAAGLAALLALCAHYAWTRLP